MEEVKNYKIDQKYRVQYEQSAVKGVLGFKVEANGDDLKEVQEQAKILLEYALNRCHEIKEVEG